MDVSKAIDKAARGVPQGGADPTSPNHGKYKTQATEGKRGEGDKGQGFGAGPGQFMNNRAGEPTAEKVYKDSGSTDFAMKPGVRGGGSVKSSVDTPEAEQWEGWGTALKPAVEIIWLVRKPLGEKTVASNVLTHGTGALNIDASRIGYQSESDADQTRVPQPIQHNDARGVYMAGMGTGRRGDTFEPAPEGRFPANVLLSHHEDCVEVGTRKVKGGVAVKRNLDGDVHNDIYGAIKSVPTDDLGYVGSDGTETLPAYDCHEECPIRMMDEQSGTSKSTGGRTIKRSGGGNVGSGKDSEKVVTNDDPGYGDKGGASRFFYQAKASGKERELGLLGHVPCAKCGDLDSTEHEIDGKKGKCRRSDHPTVKPVALMAYLIKLVTPPNGIVLDPFLGSGTTGVAAMREPAVGQFLGIEMDPHYLDIAEARIGHDIPEAAE